MFHIYFYYCIGFSLGRGSLSHADKGSWYIRPKEPRAKHTGRKIKFISLICIYSSITWAEKPTRKNILFP